MREEELPAYARDNKVSNSVSDSNIQTELTFGYIAIAGPFDNVDSELNFSPTLF